MKAKEYRDEQIRKEIRLINEKDGEARKLEQYESEILRRLRETHFRQQQAITEITEIFKSPNKIHTNPKTLLNESSRKTVDTKLVDNLHNYEFIISKPQSSDINRDEKGHRIDEQNTNGVGYNGSE